MSLERTSDDARLLAPFEETRAQKRISVYDRRSIDGEAIIVETSGLDYNQFLRFITEVLIIPSTERFVLTTTDRTVLDFDKFQELKDGNTLHLMQTEHQELPAATQEQIVFTPHYDTLVRSGMYEYYASEGQMALPYALAELIDNSISATASSQGERSIELRLLFDDTLGKPAVVFVDNGSGMTSKQLNNWAVYRLSKYTREDGKFRSDRQGYIRPEDVSRSINSDISCFGVGGKQAIFYIGNSTRMITRPTGSPDVHELILSKEDFESKAMNNEDIYSGFIHNRKVGDSSHVQKECECFLHDLIAEETKKGSFTAVVITGIPPQHARLLKNDFDKWTRELAHIYHYYIHGLNGNDLVHPLHSNINIEQISLREKPPRCPRLVNLREVDNDMQTLYINSAADTFEFKACTPSGGTVDGVLRYHPFLYDRETYPQDPNTQQGKTALRDGESGAGSQANGRRPIFECFWNGRLIPYTTLSEFEWCKRPGKQSTVPLECYSRLSGVLFANDRFQVSTNKLTFIDLELQLQKNDTIFTRIVNGQEQRVQIKREFSQWLTGCHERLDKQVHFVGFKETITRAEMQSKKMQYPWATFSSIEWDNKTFKTGQLVKSLRTQPIMYGYIVQFLLYGDHDSDIYATNGKVEISLEPKEVYDECRTFLISKIDRTATNASIQKFIDTEMNKMPDKLQLVWPEGNALSENAVMHAGARLGPLKVSILNKKGEEIARMPPSNHGARKLVMELQLTFSVYQHIRRSKKGKAERFVVEAAFPSTLRVGVAYDMVLTLLDAFDHPAPAPPLLAPELSCRCVCVPFNNRCACGSCGRCSQSQKQVSAVWKELIVVPSTRVSRLEVYFQDAGGLDSVLRNEEQVEWKAGDLLENLHYRLYDEGQRLLPLDQHTARSMKVNWLAEVNLEDLARGKLPHIQVPTQVTNKPFYQISYKDQRASVDASFILVSKDVVVRGVRFSPGQPGPRELTFTLRRFTGRVKVMLTAGPPATLQLLSGPQLPLQVFNGQGIPSPFLIQLCDAWGNPSPDKRVVVALTSSSPSLEVKCPVMSKPVDREGKASFSVKRIAGPNLEFRGLFNQRPIPGPSIQLTVVLDPSKPARLVVDYDTNTICLAGEALPVFSVSVLSEEGGPIRNVNPAALSMMLWRIETTSLPSPPSGVGVSSIYDLKANWDCNCDKGLCKYNWLDLTPPPAPPPPQYVLDVVPNEPIKLAPDSQPTTPIVSNVEAPDSRVLVKDLSLRIRVGPPAAAFSLTHGLAFGLPFSRAFSLTLRPWNSPGIDGAEYVLVFQIIGPGITLAPYLLPFRFYNDAENQKLMSELARKKDRLSGDLVKFKEYSKNLEDLTALSEKIAQFNRISGEPRRTCTIADPYRGARDVLGKVGQLALVEDDASARVISWHIQGDMDCLVTVTTAAARQVYDRTGGAQQVLPLDSIYVNPTDRPLPHLGCRTPTPPGNPVFARDLLIYPNDTESCMKVFKNLLGDTILIDDLDAGNAYRKSVVQSNRSCPTILTRRGERIGARGKFGGAQNRAPALSALQGRVFGAPPPALYHSLRDLQGYLEAFEASREAKEELNAHVQKLQSPENMKMNQAMDENKRKLTEIESQLGRLVVKLAAKTIITDLGWLVAKLAFNDYFTPQTASSLARR
uniref:Structural maintenance of chromosomes flexible hinge domain containing 1 n=1 Tax=Gadus morhua TaxID=8049 RepID=A0A8C5BD60_GADMO